MEAPYTKYEESEGNTYGYHKYANFDKYDQI